MNLYKKREKRKFVRLIFWEVSPSGDTFWLAICRGIKMTITLILKVKVVKKTGKAEERYFEYGGSREKGNGEKGEL